MEKSIEFIPMGTAHLDEVLEIEKTSFPIPYTRGMMENELANPRARYFVGMLEGRVAAYGGYWQIDTEGDVITLAVRPDLRRQGVGGALMRTILADARARGVEALTLEVRPGNTAAVALYASFGFKTVGRRKGYYQDNREDALLMRCDKISSVG